MMIRPATDDDAAALAAVHVRTWQGAYAGILPDGYLAALDPIARREPWRQRLAGRIPPSETFVAERDGTIVGFVSVGPFRAGNDARNPPGDNPAAGEVYAIYVDPDAWSTGAGRALMATAVTHLSGAGFRTIRLWVLERNARARRFYEVAGFRPDGVSVIDITDPGGPYECQTPELRYMLLID